jgi:GxxExxY protein
MTHEPLTEEHERVAKAIVEAAFEVHRALGPGLLESVYETCFCEELRIRGMKFQTQVQVPLIYKGKVLDTALRLDVIVEDLVICEIKAVEEVNPVFMAQVLSYLKLTGKRLGFLLNFHVPVIKQGIQRGIL